jgi:hypothetical protein
MKELDPGLKRLLKWARAASPLESAEAPFGFSGRVLAARKPARPPAFFDELQRAAWGLSCVALALIVCGAIVLVSQRSAGPATDQFSSALSFLASNFPAQ